MDGLQGPLWVWLWLPRLPSGPSKGAFPAGLDRGRSSLYLTPSLGHLLPPSLFVLSLQQVDVFGFSLSTATYPRLCLASHQELHFPGGQTGHGLNSQLL